MKFPQNLDFMKSASYTGSNVCVSQEPIAGVRLSTATMQLETGKHEAYRDSNDGCGAGRRNGARNTRSGC